MKKQSFKKIILYVIPIIILLLGFIFPKESWAYLTNFILMLIELFMLVVDYKDENNSLKVILSVILCFMLLTWILPTASFKSEYVEQGRLQMGIFDLLNYPVTAISYFCFLAFYIFAIGAFYGILNKIPAYRSFLDKFVKSIRGTEKFVLFIIVLTISVLTSIGGMQLAFLCLFPFLVSVIMLMGYDKIVTALTLVGSVMIGIIGNTYGESNFAILGNLIGTSPTDEMLTKVIILLLGIIILFANILYYIKKNNNIVVEIDNLDEQIENNKALVVENKKEIKSKSKESSVKTSTTKKTTKKSTGEKDTKTRKSKSSSKSSVTKKSTKKKNDNKAALFDDEVILIPNKTNEKHVIWPIVTVFILLFIIMTLSFIPWMNSFGVKTFDELLKNIVDFKLFDFPIFAKLLGTVNPFGTWTVVELTVVMLIFSLLMIVIYKISFREALNNAVDGMKKSFPFAVLAMLIYTTLIITTFHPFQLVLYKTILGVVDKFNFISILAISVTNILAGLFNVEGLYAMQSFIPHLSNIVAKGNYVNVSIISQSMYGLSMLFVPTSLILMLALSYLNISYGKWLKTIWKLVLELAVVLLIIFSIVILL